MIKLENVHRDFQVGDQVVHALDDINLEIEQGEYLSVMGPSGSGKSTLLNLIGMLDHASSGRYFLNGRDVTELNEFEEAQARNKNIGFVFQSFHLIPRLSAAENVELPLVLSGIDPAKRKDQGGCRFAKHEPSVRAHHKPEQLSGGQDSAWPLHARPSPSRPYCWRTSRQAISIRPQGGTLLKPWKHSPTRYHIDRGHP